MPADEIAAVLYAGSSGVLLPPCLREAVGTLFLPPSPKVPWADRPEPELGWDAISPS